MGVSEPKKQNTRSASVGLRWLTALIAGAIVLFFIWFGGWVTVVPPLLIVVLGSFEFYYMLIHAGHRPLIWVSLGLGILFLIAALLPPAMHLLALEIGLGASLL